MNNYSSDYTQMILNLSEILKAKMIQNAVLSAAESGFFSLLDIYRELGYKPAAGHEWYNKTSEFEPGFIRMTMRRMGIQAVKRSGRAGTRRYYLPEKMGGTQYD